jgi:hypothetical protein
MTTGDSYSGTHDFTGATINVPTATAGASGSAAASLDFVNATTSSAALPGQTGNAGKVVGTNGTNASWVSGGLRLLATLTPTVAAAINALAVFSSDYDSYLIVGQEIGTANAAPTGATSLSLWLATGGALDSGTTFNLTPGSYTLVTGSKINFTLELLAANSTDIKTLLGTSHFRESTNNRIGSVNGAYTAANTVSGLGFLWGDGSNFSATGKIYIYGRTKV